MEYKGYLIEEDKTGYAPKHLRFSYFSDDGEKYWGMEETIEDCQKQIDELIIDKIKSILKKDFGWENLDYEDKKWFIDNLIKDVHSICIGNINFKPITKMEQQLITQANETFEKLGLVNAKEYAIFKGIKPASIYNKLHSKNIVVIGGMNFYKTKEV